MSLIVYQSLIDSISFSKTIYSDIYWINTKEVHIFQIQDNIYENLWNKLNPFFPFEFNYLFLKR